jgi:uncharacterized protein (TIGR02646 family)
VIHIEKDFEALDKDKEDLNKIYHNKCAYCETKLYESAIIEQYRPKSSYSWLAYEWSNLLLVCNTCNRAKGADFKVVGKLINKAQNNREDWKANSKSFLAEKPLLLHPEIDYPEDYLYFTKDGFIHSDEERGKYTIGICQLNRESLVLRRKDIIDRFGEKFENLLFLMNKGISDEIDKLAKVVFDELKACSEKSHEFSLLYTNMFDDFDLFFLASLNEKNKYSLHTLYASYLEDKSKIVINSNDALKNIQKVSENTYTKTDKRLAYALKKIEIKNFHGIKETGFRNIPIDTQWIFLTGENGFGKTSVLQSIVLGLYGNKDTFGNKITDTDYRISLEIKQKEKNIINNSGESDFVSFKHFVAYGSSRLNVSSNEDNAKITKTYSLFHSDGYLLDIEKVLTRYAFRKEYQNQFKNIKEILCDLMPNIVDIEVVDNGMRDIVYYIEKDEENNNYEKMEFSQLASGYKSIIAMFGDMIMRLSKRQDIVSPKDLEGIVIIDELDLHFHPNWQRKLPQLLSNTFPKIQFIVSTHSVIPFLGALENSVFLKVMRDEAQGVQIHKLDIDVKNLLPNTILTSPIFDFEGLIANANDSLESVQTEDLYNEVIFNQILDEKLAKISKIGTSRLDSLFED